MEIRVQKADGKLEPFNELKLRSSLKRSGADDVVINSALSEVKNYLYDGIPTEKIYQLIFRLLERQSKALKQRYNLKQAIMNLGPTGYPFEIYVAGLLTHFGFQTSVSQKVFGKCISHEIDVVACKEQKKIMIECKFHNRPGSKSDIKVALYTYARFLDVREKNNFQEAWLVTNTKTTSDALEYAKCMNFKVISWDYPSDFSLRYLVEKANLLPITVREDLPIAKKNTLLAKGKVFLKDLETVEV